MPSPVPVRGPVAAPLAKWARLEHGQGRAGHTTQARNNFSCLISDDFPLLFRILKMSTPSKIIVRNLTTPTQADQFICRCCPGPEEPYPKPVGSFQFFVKGTHSPMPFYSSKYWAIVKSSLERIVKAGNSLTFADFTGIYQSYLRHHGELDFSALEALINSGWGGGTILNNLLPAIAQLALELPRKMWQPIRLLQAGQNGSLTLSQRQAATLLANAFYSTFPGRDNTRYSRINFIKLFKRKTPRAEEKLKCLLHYFAEYFQCLPNGAITILRQKVPETAVPDWPNMDQPLAPLIAMPTGKIEDDGVGMTQLDFANEFIGGGVLGYGIVQEEIRFLLCPELIISCLVCERMDEDEAILMIGAERYSNYDGYARTFRWLPRSRRNNQSPSRDNQRRANCEVLAIDALNYASLEVQFHQKYIDRELLKAYAGFSLRTATDNNKLKGIATGNWGCGAFGGDLHLKSMIQLLAASVVSRPIYYFTFGDATFAQQLNETLELLAAKGVTIGQLYRIIIEYGQLNDVHPNGLFGYIRESMEV